MKHADTNCAIIGIVTTGDDIAKIVSRQLQERGVRFAQTILPTSEELNRRALPLAGQTAAIAFSNPKTAALCFDRIWSGVSDEIPAEIGFKGSSPAETALLLLTRVLSAIDEAANGRGDDIVFAELTSLTEIISSLTEIIPGLTQIDIGMYSKLLADVLGAEYNLPVVPVYSSPSQRDRAYRSGDRAAIVAVLENVPVVNEDSLKWEQVRELRRDKQMLVKYRKFAHWLDKEMLEKPLSYVEDEIAVRLGDFQQAARAHGLKTTYGLLHLTLDSSLAFGGGAFLAELSRLSGKWTIFAGVAAAVARASVHIGEALLDVRTQRINQASEIAYVVELRRQGGAG
jgi:hypothetical protein